MLPKNQRAHLGNPDQKKYYNERLFSVVAPKYDFVTRALSLGQDAAWKRELIALLPSSERPHCLDLASGTGDLAFALAAKYPEGCIVGLDLTSAMIKKAREKNIYRQVTFVQGDMTKTGFADASFDIITGGYALRNAPDIDCAIAEIARLLKPQGVGAFLDFSKPSRGLLSYGKQAALKLWGSMWGLLLHGKPAVYGYLAASLARYPSRDALRHKMERAGLVQLHSRLFFLGMLELIVVKKQ